MTKETQKEGVQLNTPIVRGKTEITEITITPVLKQAGSLRGLKVYDVLTSNYDALVVLLPRVTAPALTADEIARMDTWDFCQLANAVVDFLQPPSDQSGTDTGSESSNAPANA
ncbi:phage tail assembly protein [Hafnia psychrotolerans]|uniref:Tail protein n=1 Tax=Hafnia psychrotolerans TaxID=1477018 RepID=A0ABQ1GDZ8_9GAMM|nr:phage tail assembly protein [Hafnia psychrotolerans]GGA41888.1 tail protein [Hafnia psychrotolerans]